MLPRILRLSRNGFENTPGLRRIVSPHLSLSYADGVPEGGCAIVISKKVARLSVSRHLLKRRIRAIIRPWCAPNRVLIVHARAGITPVPFVQLKEELEVLLHKALPSGTM